MGISLYSLHVPSGFGGRAKLDMSISPIFVQDVLAALSWQQEELGPEPCMSWAFPSPQWSSLLYQGSGHFLTCGPRSPECWVLAGSVRCKCYSSLSSTSTLAPENSARARGVGVGICQKLGHRLWGSGSPLRAGLSLICHLCSMPPGANHSLLRCCWGVQLPQHFMAKVFPHLWQLTLQCEAAMYSKQCWNVHSAQTGVCTEVVVESPSATHVI